MKSINEILKQAEEKKEPVFVLRAQDRTSIAMLNTYLSLCTRVDCDKFFIAEVKQIRDAFRDWQHEHPDEVKVPD